MLPASIVRAALFALLLTGGLAAPWEGAAGLQAIQLGQTEEESAVRARWLALDEAWNARDAVAFSRLFSEDTSFEFVDRGQLLEGREIVREHFEQRFPQIAPGIRHQTHVRRVSTLAPGVFAVDGGVHILEGQDNGRAIAQILRRFAISAVMTERDGGLEIRTLRIFEQPDEETGRQRVVEIRSYNLKPGTIDTFERLFVEEARPLLDEWDIDVVAYGRSLHDENSWFLIRSFDDRAQRERLETAFYGSDEWREGPRDAVLKCIESYTTLVLPFDEETVARLRRSLREG